jgi:EAL and modified HD-GYP domain-containing signal transduction protein
MMKSLSPDSTPEGGIAATEAGPGSPSPLNVYVARQPIFDRRLNLYGYELLFRSSLENHFAGTDHEHASVSVIANSFFVLGIEALTGRGRAFVNFTRATLLSEYAYVLPRERLVVEILENVEADDQVVAACARLKAAGFLIALDDYDPRAPSAKLIDLADIVKVDFMATSAARCERYGQVLPRQGKLLLAEKVETSEHHDQAMRFGYSYIQGYFFARPVIRIGHRSPGFRVNRLDIMRELNTPDPDFGVIEDLFKHDPALSYRLLRYLNSAAFALRERVTTVGRAITYLGVAGLRAWATVIILADLGSDQPFELVVTSVIRGRFCELLGRELKLDMSGSDLFLMGLFSLIDVLTRSPLEQALTDLPLASATHDALLGDDNALRPLLDLVLAFEHADWDASGRLIDRLGLPQELVPALFFEAVEWGNRTSYMS